jgi:hypothetical protein
MKLPPPTVCRKIRRLHAMARSPINANEAKVAQIKLARLLFEWGLAEADLPEILSATDDNGHPNAGPSGMPSGPQGASAGPTVNVFDLNYALIEDHIMITRHERVAGALWTLHTYVFGRLSPSSTKKVA